MRYDRLGFPIPPEFAFPPDERTGGGLPSPRPAAGRRKRMLLAAVLAAVLVPAVVAPAVLPAVGEAVMQWSIDRAVSREARGDLRSAIGEVSRAIRWAGADHDRLARLLTWRAMLRIESRDPRGGLADADRAVAVAPMLSQPRRVGALARVMLDEPDAALAAAQAAVELAGPGDPDALNHRAYVRALVGRDLEAALSDIDSALEEDGGGSAEFLDTKGFILHLLGRHHEAVDLLNRAIEMVQKDRRELAALAHRADPDDLAHRLRSLDHGLAVMLHHRGLACGAIGLAGQARQDHETATRKGYAPERGIF